MMKILKSCFLFCVFPILLFAQIPPRYAKVALTIDRPDLIAHLNQNGFEIDHFHQHGQAIEVSIPYAKIALLQELTIEHEVLISDLSAHFRKLVQEAAGLRNVSCGLDNFDEGEMGGYHSYADMQTHINSMQNLFPELVQISEIGTSVEGRTIFAVKISDNVTTDESATEGVVYYDALTHAREPMGLESLLFYMWTLLEGYNSDEEVTYLVNHRELYFVPVVNPDGYVYNQTTNPQGGGFWRKNRQDNGNNCFGIDLNRNYAHGWGNNAGSSGDPCSNTYRGPAVFSEPESQAVRDFTTSIQPAAAFSNHTYADVFLCPNGFNDDLDRYELYAEFASECIPETYRGYGNWQQTIGYYGAGTTHDYLNSVGTIAYTPEIGHAFWESPSVICNRIQEILPSMIYMAWIAGEYACFHDFEQLDDLPIWEGSTHSLKIRVKNRGLSKTAEAVSVELSSPNSAIDFLNNSVSFGNIPQRAFADNTSDPFTFTVNGELTVGERIPIDVVVYQGTAVAYTDVFYLHAGNRTILFEEDGEQGMDKWLTSTTQQRWDTTFMDAFNGNHCIADTRYGNYEPSANNVILLANAIDLTGMNHPFLEFSAKWSLDGFTDETALKVSTDNGISWTNLEGLFTSGTSNPVYINNQHWIQERIDLTDYIGNEILIGFFLSASTGVESDGFYFDDLSIVDYADPETVGVEEELSSATFTVFPNPASNRMSIKFFQQLTYFEMTLFDAHGRIVLFEQNNPATEFSLKSISSGVYWLRVFANDQVTTQKVVVVK